MKRFTSWTSVLVLVMFVACGPGNQGGTIISGKLKTPMAGETILLQKLTESGLEAIDSVVVRETGEFELRTNVDKTDFYRINLYDRQFINLILAPGDVDIKVEADGTNPTARTAVLGSSDTDRLNKIDSVARKRQSDFELLDQEARQARAQGDFETMRAIQEQFFYLSAKHAQGLKTVIWEAVPSLAALYGVNYIDVEQEFSFADSLVQAFEAVEPDHSFTRDLSVRVEGLRRLAVGADAPDINLPSPDGDLVALSSLKGNYVLIDFWAAWCRPCRIENPNVVRLYNQYKGKNFEIFGVSLDRTHEAWVKAIEDDGLIWQHVSDLQYFQSEAARTYQIQAIPATYLIDPDGKIVAKGLRGESLRAKLREIFG